MDRRKFIIWLIILLALIAALGYLLIGKNTTTTTTTTFAAATTTIFQPTTTRLITRPTQLTTTTTLPDTSTTITTIPSSTNATTTSTTATTQPDHTNPQTTTTSTTIPGATTNPTTTTTIQDATTAPSTTTTTTTQPAATTTTISGTTTTTTLGATTTSTTTRTTSTTTSTTTKITTTTTTTTTRTTTTTTMTTTTTTTTTTLPPNSCRIGPGYTFTSTGVYTANSASGIASISRSGQYTFYETPHNYVGLMNCQWSGTYACPSGTNIRFYLRAQTEDGYDYFNIRNSEGTAYEEITGNQGSFYAWTSTYSQRTAAFNFVSDTAVVDWGVDLYQIECATPTTTTTTTTRATTTTTLSGGECYGAEDCNPTGDPIGGGAGYTHVLTSGTYTVTTASQLVSAAASATSGQTIFIPSTASIDLTGYPSIVIKSGVTLASDRGYEGHLGALLYRNDLTPGGWQNGMITAKSNSRITGLRLRGFQSVYGGDYGDWSDLTTGIGVTDQTGVEIDNNEIYYFSYNGVMLLHSSTTSNYNWVHHNYIHHVAGMGEGYGIGVCRGTALIEANHFDYVRHAVSGVGYAGESYEARYNLHGTHNIDSNYDVHAADQAGSEWDGYTPSGRLYKIHHNTVPSAVDGYESLYYVSPPTEGMYIYNNRLGRGIAPHGGWTRCYMTNNYVGGVFYATGQG